MRLTERFNDMEDEYVPTEEELRQTAQEYEFVRIMMENHIHNCAECGGEMRCLGDCGYPVHANGCLPF
jgi:predicted nucleic acid-binding Zn ribbon protein